MAKEKEIDALMRAISHQYHHIQTMWEESKEVIQVEIEVLEGLLVALKTKWALYETEQLKGEA